MSLKTAVIANILVAVMRAVDRSEKVAELARKIDVEMDKAFPKRSERLQAVFVSTVLIPLCRELLNEQGSELEWQRIVGNEYKRLFG